MFTTTLVDVLPIQQVVATASPSAWRDGLVVARTPGALTIVTLDGGTHEIATRAAPETGSPVAVHPVAEVIAVGGAWYLARRLPEPDADGSDRTPHA